MKRVAEVIHVIPEEREEFLNYHLNLPEELKQVMWMHGVRNQYYFEMQGLIFMTFEYVGQNFYYDMDALARCPGIGNHLVSTRRKNVPSNARETTNWWAPLKILGKTMVKSPTLTEDNELSLDEQYREMQGGQMLNRPMENDIVFDEDDWSESVHI